MGFCTIHEANKRAAALRERPDWRFAKSCCDPEIIARFIVLIAQPPENPRANLICVDFVDYIWSLGGEGLIHVAKTTGHGCEEAEAAADAAVKQLQTAGVSLEKALGVALIVEMAAGYTGAIALWDGIAKRIKLRTNEDATVVVSAPLSRTLPADTFNVFLAVR